MPQVGKEVRANYENQNVSDKDFLEINDYAEEYSEKEGVEEDAENAIKGEEALEAFVVNNNDLFSLSLLFSK